MRAIGSAILSIRNSYQKEKSLHKDTNPTLKKSVGAESTFDNRYSIDYV
jgi:hypothetical protein